MYKPKHFKLQEWFPPSYFKAMFPIYGDLLWSVIDYRALITSDRLRERYDTPFIMNTWFSNSMMDMYGVHQWRGYRDEHSPYVKNPNSTFGNISQHRFGRAQDSVPVSGVSVKEIRKDIMNDPFHEDFKYIKCIEVDVDWLHLDYRNWDKLNKGIKRVKP